MRILATSDMHGMLDKLDLADIDLAIFAGDIAPLKGRGPWHVYDQIKWMNTEFYDWCMQWPKTKIVFVPGNHDFFPIANEIFEHKLLGKNLNIKLAANATMLIDCGIDISVDNANPTDCIRIYGTPWVPIISHSWAFEAEHDTLKQKFSDIPSNLDILVTHTPPHIDNANLIDCSLQWGTSRPFGSTELAEAIFEKKPKIVLCGHIHSGDHSKTMFGDTMIYNVARVDERYEIAYDPLILDI